jgi:hypothetical protein
VIAAVITALIMISVVSVGICAYMVWENHELQASLDLVTQKLVDVLEHRDGDAAPGRLPPGGGGV